MNDQISQVTATGEAFDPDPRRLWEAVGDLPLTMQYATAFLLAEDGSLSWTAVRSMYRGTARNLSILEGKPGADREYVSGGADDNGGDGLRPAAKFSGGPLEAAERDGRFGLWRPDGSSYVTCEGPSFAWDEGEALQLQGVVIDRALRSSFHGDVPMVVTSQPVRAAGTIDGEAARGLVLHQSFNLPDDVGLLDSPYVNELELCWVVFVNELEDGTVLSGNLIYGKRGFSMIHVQQSDGPTLATGDVTCDVTLDGGDPEYPSRLRFSGGGQTWIWEPDGDGGRWPVRSDLPEGHRLRGGVVHRDGDPRRVVAGGAFLEAWLPRL